MGYTGFTLVMPFLPLLSASSASPTSGQIAMWTGISLGITPALTALLAPAWGRLGDRYGRKIMVERSLVSFVVLFAAMGYVTRAWHVLVLRAIQGLFAGYGSLSVAMAAESAPRDRMPAAIGAVQTAQRIGPAVGPLIGGLLAGLVGLRRAFLVTAMFYAVGLVLVHLVYDDHAIHADPADPRETGRVTFRNVLAFENFILMMFVIFGLQFVDRSFGPVLPLWVEQVGVPRDRVPLVSGILFSIMAFTGALGHHFCGRLLRRYNARVVIAGGAACAASGCGVLGLSGNFWLMCAASAIFGIGIGAAMTASLHRGRARDSAGRARHRLRRADERVARRHGQQPVLCRVLRRRVAAIVFFVDLALMALLAVAVARMMKDDARPVGAGRLGGQRAGGLPTED